MVFPSESSTQPAASGLRDRIDSGRLLEIEPTCPLAKKTSLPRCDGSGHLISEEIVEDRAYSCARPCPVCQERNQAEKHRRMTDISISHYQSTLPKGLRFALDHRFVWDTPARRVVDGYCDLIHLKNDRLESEHGLILLGSPGVGKTIAAIRGWVR